MSAVRLARGYTGKEKIIKFAGCYHGHSDAFLIQAGSGAVTLVHPIARRNSRTRQRHVVSTLQRPSSVEELFQQHGDAIAAIIIEPVAGNMGCILPQMVS